MFLSSMVLFTPAESLAILLLSYTLCLPKLRLAWQLLVTRTEINLFDRSLSLGLAVAGEARRVLLSGTSLTSRFYQPGCNEKLISKTRFSCSALRMGTRCSIIGKMAFSTLALFSRPTFVD